MRDTQNIDPYYYEGTYIFINKKGIYDIEVLKKYEGAVTLMRMVELSQQPISGDHSLQHWQAIHRHIFQDVYPWAGQLRTISLFEEYASPYSSPDTVESGFKNLVIPILEQTKHLQNSSNASIVKDISTLMGELYFIHPFRDGNTRSLIQFVKEIARNAEIKIDFSAFSASQWSDLQHGIVLAAHEQDTQTLESTIKSAVHGIARNLEEVNNLSPGPIQAVRREHAHLLDTATAYTDALKTYTQAKEAQALRIESRLEKAVAVQQAMVAESRAHRPGVVSSLWRGKAWEQRHQTQATRLLVLERRLEQVRGIRADMGGKRLAELARKKLQYDKRELVAKHDAEERIRRERQAEDAIQKNALRQAKERSQTQSRGRRQGIER